MTLRARLTAAFLAVVFGPVLLGAVLVGVAVTTADRTRSAERLDLATTGVRTALAATCDRLTMAARAAALASSGEGVSSAAQFVTSQNLATWIQVVGADGAQVDVAGDIPVGPWADCAYPDLSGTDVAYRGIFTRAQVQGADGQVLGYATAARPVDASFVRDLAAAGGVAVTVLPDGALTTEGPADRDSVAMAADGLRGSATGATPGGRLVRRVDPGPGQPLSLGLSVRRDDPQPLYATLLGVVVVAGLLAVAAAWWLARTTTRPLAELAHSVDRVARGDLAVRAPVRAGDEVGKLAATFNRMAHETQGYVRALTASRDQLRGHLGLLGDTLSSTHDVDRILRVILQSALTGTGAQAGAIFLLDPASDTLVARCLEGVPLAGDDIQIPLGEGLLGSVAASAEARAGRVDRDGPELVPEEPSCRTYVAVPFSAPETAKEAVLEGHPLASDSAGALSVARGVLALYDRHGFDEFDDADLETLRTFAAQAAVALDNVRAHKEVERLSLTDPLTGLSNYRYLKEALRREVERASRYGHTLTVLALDVDRFKEVNDTYGHAAGDAVLVEFAHRVRAEIRDIDFAFRQGGEEFVVLLPETDAAGGVAVAERLGAAVRHTPVTVPPSGGTNPHRIPVTVSIGIAVYPDHGGTGPIVLEAADDSLYAAKAAGRDTYRVAQRRSDTRPVCGHAAIAKGGGVAIAKIGGVSNLGGVPNGAAPPRQSRGG